MTREANTKNKEIARKGQKKWYHTSQAWVPTTDSATLCHPSPCLLNNSSLKTTSSFSLFKDRRRSSKRCQSVNLASLSSDVLSHVSARWNLGINPKLVCVYLGKSANFSAENNVKEALWKKR